MPSFVKTIRDKKTFIVENINEKREVIAKGSLKISVTDVVFSSKTLSLQWPLNGIREYGFHDTEQDLFLFEAGRRCPNGEGLYAFRCRHPQAIYTEFDKAIEKALAKAYRQTSAEDFDEKAPEERGGRKKLCDGGLPRRSWQDEATLSSGFGRLIICVFFLYVCSALCVRGRCF